MKKSVFYFAVLLLGTLFMQAKTGKETIRTYFNYGKSFVFVENGVTFSVYPDGEFDFYINDRVNVGAQVSFGNSNITFNSGYNYNPFVQYDDYGAVIQVQNVPIYYDYYGRVNQIGGINIWYRNNRVRRIGGLHVYYNNRGYFDYYRGYINIYNRHYVYRPYHGYFVRPAIGFCQVFPNPYRRYYYPVRYTYYRPYHHNYRRAYAAIGKPYHHYDRGYRRSKIYRNDRRVAVRKNHVRNDYNERRGSDRYAGNRGDKYAKTVRRTATTRSTNGSRTNINRSSVVRNSEPGRKSVKRTIANNKRPSNRSTVRTSSRDNTVKTNRRSITNSRKELPKRTQAVSRSSTTSKNRNKNQGSNRTYTRKIKSSKTVTSRPSNRTARSSEMVRRSTPQRSNTKSKGSDSQSRKKGTVQRSSSRRVR